MAMRYLIRRGKPEDTADLKSEIPDLDAQLGTPAEDLRRMIRVPYTPLRHALFCFYAKKKDAGWVWSCPSIELVAEDERGLFVLTDRFGVAKPSHLAHVPA